MFDCEMCPQIVNISNSNYTDLNKKKSTCQLTSPYMNKIHLIGCPFSSFDYPIYDQSIKHIYCINTYQNESSGCTITKSKNIGPALTYHAIIVPIISKLTDLSSKP